ncbi:MAG: ribosome maturation factor RimP [Bacillota bacterium]
MSLSEIIEAKISGKVEQLGCEVVEINYEKGRKGEPPTLWIYIYKESGVDYEVLSEVQENIEPLIDEIEELEAKYHLNISSPGLDRAFKTPRDFERNMGKEIEIKFYAPFEGKKMQTGILKEYNQKSIIATIGGKDKVIELKQTSKISQAIKF